MNSFVNFTIESGISLSVLGIIYYLFLRKETFFLQNRIFLFVSVVFSLLLPFLRFRIYETQIVQLPELTVTPDYNFFKALTSYGHDVSQSLEHTAASIKIVLWIYLTGTVFFFLRFSYKCLQIYQLRSRGNVQKVSGIKLIRTDGKMAPFSFLDIIFIPQDLESHEGYNQILLHEMEHVKQHHSYDILIVEFLIIIQWCNPFVWLLKRAIHENHEYLADKSVLAAGVQQGQYKLLLLNQCLGERIFIGSPFNYSLIKNRIKMMNKIKSHKIANVKYLLGIFIAVGLVVAFALENKLAATEMQLPILQDDEVTVKVIDGNLSFEGNEQKIKEIIKIISKIDNKRLLAKFTNNQNNRAELLLRLKESTSKKNQSVTDSKVFTRVEEMPEYPGGQEALLLFLSRNVNYPKEAYKKGLQGKVYLKFVVKKTGEVGEVLILRSPDKLLSTEAIRVVKMLPKFKPGMQRGNPVNVWYHIPITFRISDTKKSSGEEVQL